MILKISKEKTQFTRLSKFKKIMLDKLRKLLYSSFLGLWYFNLLLWWDKKKNDYSRNYSSNTSAANVNTIVYNAQKAAYSEGVARIKAEVTKRVNKGSKVDYERELANDSELLKYAKNEGNSAHAETLKLYVRKDKDIKNNTDLAKMVEQRILDYYELQRYNEERNLIKAIKKAKKENNLELASELEKQWSNKYGRSY